MNAKEWNVVSPARLGLVALVLWILAVGPVAAGHWSRSYDGPLGTPRSIAPTSDGGIVSVSHDLSSSTTWITKLDGDGEILWRKSWIASLALNLGSIASATSDGGAVVAGTVSSQLSILKLGSAGGVDWHRRYDSAVWPVATRASGVVQMADGGYGVSGSLGNSDTVLVLKPA